MKLNKSLWVACISAFSLMMAFASSASATTLETNGVKQTGEVEIRKSLKAGTSATLKATDGTFLNTMTVTNITAKTSTSRTGLTVSGPVSSLSFSGATHEKIVVDANGSLSIEWIKGTTNGTVRSSGLKMTMPVTIFGSVVTATCTTENTDMGTLTGVASGSATLDMNAVLNCGSIVPSAKLEGTYVSTTSAGGSHAIGVVE
jgi:hypothetical protein